MHSVLQLNPSSNVTPTTLGELRSLSGDPVKDILQQIFGHQSFRKGQEEAIRTIMKGLDTLIVMPTGKTLCYAIPAVISKGITIVVTPLLALMDDQVKRLRKQKMSVCYINSTMAEDEKDNVLHCLSQKGILYDILFITPEALLTPQLQAIVKRMSEAGHYQELLWMKPIVWTHWGMTSDQVI